MSKILDLTIEETAQHKRAFTIYSTLDPELSTAEREAQVAQRLGCGVESAEVHTWASLFHWEERLAQDVQIIQKGMDARTRKDKLREKVEKVVRPPRKPVMTKSRTAGGSSGFALVQASAAPIRRPPAALEASVPQGIHPASGLRK